MCPFSVRADVCCARSFSWKPALSFSVLAEAFRMHRAFPLCAPDFPGAQVSRLPQLFQQLVAWPSPSLHRHTSGTGISTRRPIGYAFRPRLRSRLSQRGRAFLWRPWAIGAWILARAATHAGILSSMRSTCPSGHASPLHAMLPYHIPVHSFGVMLSPGKLSAQSHSTSELLRTL